MYEDQTTFLRTGVGGMETSERSEIFPQFDKAVNLKRYEIFISGAGYATYSNERKWQNKKKISQTWYFFFLVLDA